VPASDSENLNDRDRRRSAESSRSVTRHWHRTIHWQVTVIRVRTSSSSLSTRDVASVALAVVPASATALAVVVLRLVLVVVLYKNIQL
jgi:hypothetical protein